MKRILFLISIIGTISGFAITSIAYDLNYKNGFSPIPTNIYLYSSASSEVKTSVHNACVTWNNAGVGPLVYRSLYTHTVNNFPYKNNRNQITIGDRGNSYLMCTKIIQYSNFWQEIYEADIDINSFYEWSYNGKGLDFQSGITHEIGHLLGLGHSDIIYATMVSNLSPGTTWQRTLHSDDINGIKAIYN